MAIPPNQIKIKLFVQKFIIYLYFLLSKQITKIFTDLFNFIKYIKYKTHAFTYLYLIFNVIFLNFKNLQKKLNFFYLSTQGIVIC